MEGSNEARTAEVAKSTDAAFEERSTEAPAAEVVKSKDATAEE